MSAENLSARNKEFYYQALNGRSPKQLGGKEMTVCLLEQAEAQIQQFMLEHMSCIRTGGTSWVETSSSDTLDPLSFSQD